MGRAKKVTFFISILATIVLAGLFSLWGTGMGAHFSLMAGSQGPLAHCKNFPTQNPYPVSSPYAYPGKSSGSPSLNAGYPPYFTATPSHSYWCFLVPMFVDLSPDEITKTPAPTKTATLTPTQTLTRTPTATSTPTQTATMTPTSTTPPTSTPTETSSPTPQAYP